MPPTSPATGAYFAFIERLIAANARLPGLYQQVSEAAATLEPTRIASASAALRDFASTELAWVETIQPAPCYAELHGTVRSVLTDYTTAADQASQWALGYPSADPTLLSGALASATRATTGSTFIPSLMDSAAEACLGAF
ncbi:MAG: hypothetical protein H0V12_08060 [Chloroflexi bacterium]|nr:hypothetical protein [Chloroflexota bacterium]